MLRRAATPSVLLTAVAIDVADTTEEEVLEDSQFVESQLFAYNTPGASMGRGKGMSEATKTAVAELVANDRSSPEIARALNLKPSTTRKIVNKLRKGVSLKPKYQGLVVKTMHRSKQKLRKCWRPRPRPRSSECAPMCRRK